MYTDVTFSTVHVTYNDASWEDSLVQDASMLVYHVAKNIAEDTDFQDRSCQIAPHKVTEAIMQSGDRKLFRYTTCI